MTELQDAINRNRDRQRRYEKAERLLRAIRLRIFDYEDLGKAEQANRIMEALKARLAPLWAERAHNVSEPKLRNKWM